MARARRSGAAPVLQAMSRLDELQKLVPGPLNGRGDREGEQASAGKRTPAQIVEHLALGLELSAQTSVARRAHAPMARRRRTPAPTIATILVLGLDCLPP